MSGRKDITHQRFGRLVAVERLKHSHWKLQCDCGKEHIANLSNLLRGLTTSCGCFSREAARARQTTHGCRNTPEYAIWSAMKRRCLNPNVENWDRYGGRGIQVCERWLVFANFLQDMGKRPAGLTLERKDVDGNYEPANCCWATRIEQAKNKRNNRIVVIDGKPMIMKDACRHFGLARAVVYKRIQRGWPESRWFVPSLKSKN